MRITTWNVNSIRARQESVVQWLTMRKFPEIVCLQETKVVDDLFPLKEFEKLGYKIAMHGEKAYNGVAILSKFSIEDVKKGMGSKKADKQARVISAKINGVRIVNVYIPNGQAIQSEKYVWKFEFLKELNKFVKKIKDKDIILCGDFNIAPQEIDIWDASKYNGHIMFSDPERKWLNDFIDSGFHDTFRELHPDKKEYSWYDYRTNAYEMGNRGWRIDFILTTSSLAEKANGCVIDCEPRAWDKPSDHCPVVAKFDI